MTDALHQAYWPDAELERIEIDFDDLRFEFLESTGRKLRAVCEGVIGHEMIGFWDEVVIEAVEIAEDGAFLDRCRAQIKDHGMPSGSPARNRDGGLQLTLTLIDGCKLLVAMKGFRIEAAG